MHRVILQVTRPANALKGPRWEDAQCAFGSSPAMGTWEQPVTAHRPFLASSGRPSSGWAEAAAQPPGPAGSGWCAGSGEAFSRQDPVLWDGPRLVLLASPGHAPWRPEDWAFWKSHFGNLRHPGPPPSGACSRCLTRRYLLSACVQCGSH